ncbi:glycosyltransferase [Candidatus Parcubacteria bacterium]|nr:glycosyltransferase [Candidatus Parcubacteria bacterium]
MERSGLKVLMVSGDRQILKPGSAVSARMKEYGGLVGELHIVLLSDKSHGLRETKISDNVWVYPTNSSNRFLRPLDAVKIGEKIAKDKSLITTQDPFECGWAGMRLKGKFGIPLEVQLHTDPNSPHFSGLLNWARKRIMRMVMKHADTVRDVVNLPIYVDRSRIDGEPKFDLHKKYGFKTVLLMVTRLEKEKNIGLAIEALKRVRMKYPDTGLVIVGSGRESFEGRDGVVLAGWQEDLALYYKTADIFIQTSDYEGYGLSLVEAGLSGLPAISTPVGIAPKLENVVIASTPEEFAEAIESFMANPKTGLRRELEAKILSRDAYLAKIRENWERTAELKP